MAYHPKNDNHSLRIAEAAQPWASDYLLPCQNFVVTLSIEGVCDYFCAPHEQAGMVGRSVVGKAVGPGTLPFDYFKAADRPWQAVPPAAQRAFPPVQKILQKKIVPLPEPS